MRYRFTLAAALVSFVIMAHAGKPVLKVAKDGFPSGQSTPEGAASDLARAFINRDLRLFRQVCIQPFGSGEARSEYTDFLEHTSETLTRQAKQQTPSPDNPQKITKVFAARHLSKGGPSSFGYAAFGFRHVMFVDLGVLLNDGSSFVKRTLVIQDRDGKWYAHPAPHLASLLSDGLEQESTSSQPFSAVYEVQRQ